MKSLPITCHAHDPHHASLPDDRWEPREDGLLHCAYCGSIHPMEVVRLHEAGVALAMELADQKYGYPHKFYVDGLPNPLEGQPRELGSASGPHITQDTPGATFRNGQWQALTVGSHGATTHGKFYTRHAIDLPAADLERLSLVLEATANIALWRDHDGSDLAGPKRLKGSSPKGKP